MIGQYKAPIFRLVEHHKLEKKPSIIKSLILVSPTIVIICYLTIANWNILLREVPRVNMILVFFSGLWVIIGPMLILKHYKHTDEYLNNIGVDICQAYYEKRHTPCIYNINSDDSGELSSKTHCSIKHFKKLFHNNQKKITIMTNVFWCSLIFFTLIFNRNALIVVGINYLNTAQVALFMLVALYIGYLSSLGLSQTITMIWSVIHICNIKLLRYDPIACDDKHNLSFIGNYSVMTARLLSSGILFFPIIILFMKYANNHNAPTLPLMLLYTMVLIIAIVIPLYVVYIYSKKTKDSVISCLQKDFIESIHQSLNQPTFHNELKCATLQRELELVKNQKIELISSYDIGNAILTIGTPLIGEIFFSSEFLMVLLKILKLFN